MSKAFARGTEVEWNWGQGKGTGRIAEVHTSDVTRTIKGSQITRHASKDAPAYLIEQDDGDRILKSHSELSKGS